MSTTRTAARVLACALAMVSVAAPVAHAAIPKLQFGPHLDRTADYDPENSCDPDAERGVVAFKRFILNAFPGTGEGYIERSCSGGTSEHEEGRAWDWMVNVNDASDRRAAEAVIDWLLRRDARGNPHAMFNRVGLMYLIWNRRIWTPWYRWHNYYGSNPHTDHIHFSFTWRGARKRTTFYHRQRSFISAAAAQPASQALWLASGGGAVFGLGGADFHGQRSRRLNPAIVGIASSRGADGYWMATRSGKVLPFGDARSKGSAPAGVKLIDIASTRSGRGYWLTGEGGRVFAFGDAPYLGSVGRPIDAAAFARSRVAGGYWVVSKTGRVFAFGNAPDLGGLTIDAPVVTGIAASAGNGYWIATRRGKVFTFGDAGFYGDASGFDLKSPVVAIAPTPTGMGYRLVTAMGRVFSFGNANDLALRSAATERARITRAPEPGLLQRLLHLDVD